MFLTAAALALAPLPAYAPSLPLSSIRKIVCENRQGTATVIAPGILLSVHHVTEPGRCIDTGTGREAVPYISDAENDFSLLRMDTAGLPAMKYTCSRFQAGSFYYSYGYGMGRYQYHPALASSYYSTTERLEDGTPFPGMRFLTGYSVGGMSGGPIISNTGYIYGVVNIGNRRSRTFSRELADTALCKNS